MVSWIKKCAMMNMFVIKQFKNALKRCMLDKFLGIPPALIAGGFCLSFWWGILSGLVWVHVLAAWVHPFLFWAHVMAAWAHSLLIWAHVMAARAHSFVTWAHALDNRAHPL